MERGQKALAVIAFTLIAIAAMTFIFAGVTGNVVREEKISVTIGVIAPLTGEASFYGKQVQRGVELAYQETRVPINLVFKDSLCTKQGAERAFDELIAENKDMIAIIGDVCSDATQIIENMAFERQIVVISPASTSKDIGKNGLLFRTIPTLDSNESYDEFFRGNSEQKYSISVKQSEDFRKKYSDRYAIQPGPFASQSFDAFNALVQALQSGARNKEELKVALYGVAFEGASGQISFDAKGNLLERYSVFTKI